MNDYNTIVEDHWSRVDCSSSDKNFYCFLPIRSRSCKLIFDEIDADRKDWCEYWTVEKYFKNRIPFKKALSICCGFGHIERTLTKLNVAEKIIGIDIAPRAIEEARKRAKEEHINNIEYYVSDLNKEEIGNDEYDLIWANGALHHIKDLEYVIPNLYNALKVGGFLVANEYVGPNYQQVGKRQEEIINAIIYLLPHNMKKHYKYYIDYSHKSFKNYVKDILNKIDKIIYKRKAWHKPPIKYFLRTDPSECINSINIIPILKKTFDHVDVRYFNGSILFYALEAEFYNNYDFNNISHRKLLELLFNIENTFIELGEISNDNAHIICSKY